MLEYITTGLTASFICSAIQNEKHAPAPYCMLILNHYTWQLFSVPCGFQFLADRCPNHRNYPHM